MAWNIHWQTSFKSFGGTLYTVNIYEMNYNGSIVYLTPAEDAFSTMEESSNDPFRVIRAQTGYLRVIVDDVSVVNEIMPTNETSRMIKLMQGTTVKWQGFLSKQNYKQPYNDYRWKVEFALKSMLSMLDSVKYQFKAGVSSLREVISAALLSIYDIAEITPSKVYVMNPATIYNGIVQPTNNEYYPQVPDDYQLVQPSVSGSFLAAQIGPHKKWFTITEKKINGRIHTMCSTVKASEVITDILKGFCGVIRESGEDIIIALFHNTPSVISTYTYLWADFVQGESAGDHTTTSHTPVSISFQNTEDNISIDYIFGKVNTNVNFKPEVDDILLWKLPKIVLNSNVVINTEPTGIGYVIFTQYPWILDDSISREEYHWYASAPGTDDPITNIADVRDKILNGTLAVGALPQFQETIQTSDHSIENKSQGLYIKTYFPNISPLVYPYAFTFNLPKIGDNKILLQIDEIGSLTYDIFVFIRNNNEYLYNYFSSWDDRPMMNKMTRTYDSSTGITHHTLICNLSGRSGDFTIMIGGKDVNGSQVYTFGDILVKIYDTSKESMSVYDYESTVKGFELTDTNFYSVILVDDPDFNDISLPIGTFDGNKITPNELRKDGYFIDKFNVNGTYYRIEEIVGNTYANYYAQRRQVLTTIRYNYQFSKRVVYKIGNRKFIPIEAQNDWNKDKVKIKYIEVL